MENKVIRPDAYRTEHGDLFDEWYERYALSSTLYTGEEVFIAIMKAVGERYYRRFPNKNPEDLQKGNYTYKRLSEYPLSYKEEL